MDWRIEFSRDTIRFLEQNHLDGDFIVQKIQLTLRKFAGEDVNVHVKRLQGAWSGFHRIRQGKIRMIVAFSFDDHCAYIETIDWRGNVYK